MVGVTEGCEVEAGAGEEAAGAAGRYCIHLSRVFASAVSWLMLRLARLARDLFRCDQTGLSSQAWGGIWQTVSQSRAATGRPSPG